MEDSFFYQFFVSTWQVAFLHQLQHQLHMKRERDQYIEYFEVSLTQLIRPGHWSQEINNKSNKKKTHIKVKKTTGKLLMIVDDISRSWWKGHHNN